MSSNGRTLSRGGRFVRAKPDQTEPANEPVTTATTAEPPPAEPPPAETPEPVPAATPAPAAPESVGVAVPETAHTAAAQTTAPAPVSTETAPPSTETPPQLAGVVRPRGERWGGFKGGFWFRQLDGEDVLVNTTAIAGWAVLVVPLNRTAEDVARSRPSHTLVAAPMAGNSHGFLKLDTAKLATLGPLWENTFIDPATGEPERYETGEIKTYLAGKDVSETPLEPTKKVAMNLYYDVSKTDKSTGEYRPQRPDAYILCRRPEPAKRPPAGFTRAMPTVTNAEPKKQGLLDAVRGTSAVDREADIPF